MVLFSEYFVREANLIGSLVVSSEYEDESDDGADESSDVGEVGVDFVEAAAEGGFLHGFHEVEFYQVGRYFRIRGEGCVP
jgi:hypothetical protein